MEIRCERGVLIFVHRDRPVLEAPAFLAFEGPAGRFPSRIERFDRRGDGVDIEGALGPAARFVARLRRTGKTTEHWDAGVEILYLGREPSDARVRVELRAIGADSVEWLIPGIFAGTAPGGGATLALRADRCAWPAVFCHGPRGTAAVSTRERFGRGLAGVWLRDEGGEPSFGIDFPQQEGPAPPSEGRVPDLSWQPGTRLAVSFRIHIGPPDPAGFRHHLREIYARESEASPLRPWVSVSAAAELAAHGLAAWHVSPATGEVAERAAFDDDEDGAASVPSFRTGGFGATGPAGIGLLLFGRARQDDGALRAGFQILNRLAESLSPAGVFWTRWKRGRGWDAPPGGAPSHAVAEVALNLARALAIEPDRHASWGAAARTAIEAAARRQAPDGGFGAVYDPATGESHPDDGTEGLQWIATLLEAARIAGREDLRAAALRAGGFYAPRIESGRLWRARGEDPRRVTDPPGAPAYRAVRAYVALYETTGDGAWLRIAQLAAEWLFAFRWIHNVRFPRHTLLSIYDYRSRGADAGPVIDGFVHTGGLAALPALLRLWRATGDDHIWHRVRDHAIASLQLIAREDGDFGARKGMAPGRFHQTVGSRPKGTIPLASRASALGGILLAIQEVARIGIDLRLDLVTG
ncbi:MAG: hypothetical protein JXP34_02560 [Planctomycetes bacterium]|nr:hypothetical protein [Planctomycetota bacterium]